MEHSSDLVAEGRLIEESSYQNRPESFSQVELEGIKIDFYNHRDKVIHEKKKSDKKSEKLSLEFGLKLEPAIY